MTLFRNIGAHLDVRVGVNATNQSGSGTINGAAIDRYAVGGNGLFSGIMQCFRGTDAGGASPATVQFTLEDSADGSTGWATVTNRNPNLGTPVNIQSTAMTVDGGQEEIHFDLSGARQFIRVTAVVVLTGGSTPTMPIAAGLILGGDLKLPA